MTLRITLLVLVTGLFASIWTHDRPAGENPSPEIAQKPALSSRLLVQDSQPREVAIREELPTALVLPVSRARREIPVDEAWMFHACDMPLPQGIVPGEYRAVSNTGLVREFTLTLEDLQTYLGIQTRFVTRDVYQSETETLRWHFIRVQSDSNLIVPVIAERGRHIVTPAVAERSQSQRIQQQASRIIVNAGQNLARRVLRLVKTAHDPARMSIEETGKIRL